MKTQRYDAIDFLKFFASILIISLHASALYDFSVLLNGIICEGVSRLCVPFFFTVSAFFYFSKPLCKGNVKKYCYRLLKLYFMWFIISLPKTIYDRFICSSYTMGVTVFRFIRSIFTTSTFSGSWFIVSCLFCALLYYWLSKIKNRVATPIIIILCLLSYAWITFTSGYGCLIEKLGISDFYKTYEMFFGKPYTSFLVGIPYFAIGQFFVKAIQSRESASMEGKEKTLHIFGSILCLFLLLFEIIMCNRYELSQATDCYLMLFPCIYFIFPLVLNMRVSIKNAQKLRIASTILFFSHFLFLFACEIAEWMFKITIPHIGKFLVTLVSGLCLTWIILNLQNKKGFHWLKWLY